MAKISVVIRIDLGESGALDWTVDPETVTVQDAMEVISGVLERNFDNAFEYEDEEGDRITVRTAQDMINMLSFHFELETNEPLQIFPKYSGISSANNADSLNVATGASADLGAQLKVESAMDVQSPVTGSQKRSGDIQQILSCGSITDSDLVNPVMLGSGIGGTVYKYFHRPSNRDMAVKVIALDVTQEQQRQIIAELEILYQCNSAYIIAFYGAFFIESRISLCTEYMDGGSLDKMGQIEEPVLGLIATSVIKGLEYLWNMRILHRDVKPSNILVNTNGHVKLCDFGVSVQLVTSIAKTYVGTNVYMAPERIRGEPYSIQADVWSLGITLFEMALGDFPYEQIRSKSVKPIEVMKIIVEQVPPQAPLHVCSEPFRNFTQSHPWLLPFMVENCRFLSEWVKAKLVKLENS